MSTGLNRALQVRTADRLRAELARDEATGLPLAGALSEVDRRELCEVGGGRVAAVAICIDAWTPFKLEPKLLHHDGERALVVREVARFVDEHVRRTDLVGWLSAETLLVVAPGIDAIGSRNLAERLQVLLARDSLEIAGMPLALRVRVGAASRSHASPSSWTLSALGAEAELQANEPLSVATVA
jgi:GGDEF domain-containing protein